MRATGIVLLAGTALLTGGGAMYFLIGLIFLPWDQFDRIAILMPLLALSIGDALFTCLLCLALLLRLGRKTAPRPSPSPGQFRMITTGGLLGLIALVLGIPSLSYFVLSFRVADPGLRLIFLPISLPGIAIAAFCIWRIAALRRAAA